MIFDVSLIAIINDTSYVYSSLSLGTVSPFDDCKIAKRTSDSSSAVANNPNCLKIYDDLTPVFVTLKVTL